MAETSACRRAAVTRIIAALAAAVCLLAVFGSTPFGARQAYAAETGNISFSVPAKVPFAVKADGTVVGPSVSAWRIENDGARPLRIAGVAADGFADGSSVMAVSEAMPVAGTSSMGIWSVSAGRDGARLTSSYDGTMSIPVGGAAGFAWSAELSDGSRHAARPTASALGTISFTLGNAEPVAFAVYSADDGSLDFYRRLDVPAAGDTFNGKVVTEVYTGFETEHCVFETEGSNHVPWFDIRKKVKSVCVVDPGIRPGFTHAWFAQMESLASCDISALDTSRCTVFYDMFNGCTALETLDLTHMDTSSAKYMGYMLKNCPKLKSVDVSSFDTSRCQDLSIMFGGCTELAEVKGLGNWDTSSCRWMNLMFAGCKNLTVLDGLENWDVRSVETMESMFELCENLQRVDVSRFEGKSLTSTHAMFFHCRSLKTVDVSNLVTGACTDIICMFDGCVDLTSIQGLDTWDVSNVSKCHQVFYYCCSMQAIDVGNWKMSPSGTIQAMFFKCSSLRELDLSGFDLAAVTQAYGLFEGDSSLSKVTLGDGWKWIETDSFLPAPSADTIPGADGKWYSATTGRGYAPADIPAGRADTYVASRDLLPKVAFAVYSADDVSLNFYKRPIGDAPVAGDSFEGKAATDVYTGFETETYTGTWPDDDCPWFDIATKVESVAVVDAIRPKSMAWWFNQFTACTSFDLGNVDTSECVSLRRLFSGCMNCTSITGLDAWDTSNVADLSATFDYVIKLKTIPGISGWNTANVKYFAATFYNLHSLEQLDLSNWDDSSLIPGTPVDGIGYSGDIVGSTYGTVKSLKSFTVGAKWSHTGYLARRIELASSSTVPTDGKWYAASDGASYESNAVPGNRADTYYASAALAVAAKDAASWTLDDQQLVAEDIAAKGEASPFYAKAKAAMDAETTWSVKLTNGKTLEYRIIGINHDDLINGSGKAGLTFEATNTALDGQRMNATDINVGGWEASELRGRLNIGDLWSLLPTELQSKVKAVTKMTDNKGGGNAGTLSATTDKVFLLSATEVYGDFQSDGTQYEYYQSKGVTTANYSGAFSGFNYWTRSVNQVGPERFLLVSRFGNWLNAGASNTIYVFPAFCL